MNYLVLIVTKFLPKKLPEKPPKHSFPMNTPNANPIPIHMKDGIPLGDNGDSGNDLDMIQRCHTGIAMGNGFDELKKAADYVSDDIDHDGLAKAMEHFDLV